jgi:hypothetical protein
MPRILDLLNTRAAGPSSMPRTGFWRNAACLQKRAGLGLKNPSANEGREGGVHLPSIICLWGQWKRSSYSESNDPGLSPAVVPGRSHWGGRPTCAVMSMKHR